MESGPDLRERRRYEAGRTPGGDGKREIMLVVDIGERRPARGQDGTSKEALEETQEHEQRGVVHERQRNAQEHEGNEGNNVWDIPPDRGYLAERGDEQRANAISKAESISVALCAMNVDVEDSHV